MASGRPKALPSAPFADWLRGQPMARFWLNRMVDGTAHDRPISAVPLVRRMRTRIPGIPFPYLF